MAASQNFVGFLAATAIAVFGQPGLGGAIQNQAAAADPLGRAMEQLNRGRYLEAIEGLRAEAAKDPNGMPANLLEQVEPFLTGTAERGARNAPTGEAPSLDPALKQQFETATTKEALPEIVRRARQTNIVMLNEAHNSPRDRAFGLQVARALRPLGYSVLAAEAFHNDADPEESATKMAALAKDRYPRVTSGFYIRDPVFGDFIRQSLALGYRPVAYEHVGRASSTETREERINAREQGQAENLIRKIFAKDPKAKVLVFVGYSHLAEAPIGSARTEWMAARLKKMTGIDPLTIDQTTYSDAAMSEANKAYYGLIAHRVKRPSLLISGGRALRGGPYKDAVDLQIVHPPTRYRNGRATWLHDMGRRPVEIPSNLLPRSGKRLIQAFIATEAGDAVPVDQVVVEAGKPAPKLMLPRARVRFTYQDPG
jgi:hypothetical protein